MNGVAAPVRLNSLTGIRGLAAWYVVFYHIRLSLVALLPAPVIAALGKGYLAVDLFFMLSGFVLWLNHAAPLCASGRGEVLAFWWKRVARIWPLHGLVLAGFVAFAALLAATGHNTRSYPPGELPLHVLLVQNWGFTTELTWNHPAWSISTELAAYLMFPLLALSARWRLPVAALVALAGVLLAGLHLLFALNLVPTLGGEIPRLGLARCLIEFTLGTVAARLWQALDGRAGAGLAGALASGAILAAGIGLGLAETAFVPAALFAGLLALALDRSRSTAWLGRGVVLWLGEISYSTYLAHFGLFILFKLAFVDESLQLGWAGLAAFAALVLAASAALHRWVEKPAQRWLAARRPGLAQGRGAATA